MKSGVKVIFHIDLNQFFCSVAILKNPRLKGKAFAIGREGSLKGVVSTASYEARSYGIHAGMPLVEAYQKLPSLTVVDYGHEVYGEYSKKFFKFLSKYSNEIEQTSIDEGFMDVTKLTLEVNRHPLDLAKEIQSRALKELSLPLSIGIAPTLYLAKMASDMKKPLGITILRIKDIPNMLYPLDVKEIFGIGKKTYPYLKEAGILTIGDFVKKDNELLVRKLVGNTYDHFIEALSGKSTNIVDPYRHSEPESISKSVTFDTPLITYNDILDNILSLALDSYSELRRKGKKAKTVSITLRDTNFQTITRSKSLPDYTHDKTLLMYYIEELVENNFNGQILRLVGAGFSNFCDDKDIEEITLFNYQSVYEKEETLSNLISDYKERFGTKSLFFGKDMLNKK